MANVIERQIQNLEAHHTHCANGCADSVRGATSLYNAIYWHRLMGIHEQSAADEIAKTELFYRVSFYDIDSRDFSHAEFYTSADRALSVANTWAPTDISGLFYTGYYRAWVYQMKCTPEQHEAIFSIEGEEFSDPKLSTPHVLFAQLGVRS